MNISAHDQTHEDRQIESILREWKKRNKQTVRTRIAINWPHDHKNNGSNLFIYLRFRFFSSFILSTWKRHSFFFYDFNADTGDPFRYENDVIVIAIHLYMSNWNEKKQTNVQFISIWIDRHVICGGVGQNYDSQLKLNEM